MVFRLLRGIPYSGALPAPPYFCSHFSSSRTLIFPCHGFLSSPWPSPGKISSVDRDAQRVESALQQIRFADIDADVVGARDDMRGRA